MTGHTDPLRDDLLETAEVCELLRVSRTTLWKLERTTAFPKHISYGMRMKRWKRSDVIAYRDQQPGA